MAIANTDEGEAGHVSGDCDHGGALLSGSRLLWEESVGYKSKDPGTPSLSLLHRYHLLVIIQEESALQALTLPS